VAHVKTLVANVRAGLAHFRVTAAQVPPSSRWRELVRCIVDQTFAANVPNSLKTTTSLALLSGQQRNLGSMRRAPGTHLLNCASGVTISPHCENRFLCVRD
jgi:hypothetical protein